MKIDIRRSNVPLSTALREHTAHRLRLALRSMTSRLVLVGCVFTAVGIVLVAAGAWLGSDPLATQFRRLLTGGLCLTSGLSCLVTAYRWMRLDKADTNPLSSPPRPRPRARPDADLSW